MASYEYPQTNVGIDYRRLGVQLVLIALGLLIGVSGGFYFAIKTIPLPDETTVYITR